MQFAARLGDAIGDEIDALSLDRCRSPIPVGVCIPSLAHDRYLELARTGDLRAIDFLTQVYNGGKPFGLDVEAIRALRFVPKRLPATTHVIVTFVDILQRQTEDRRSVLDQIIDELKTRIDSTTDPLLVDRAFTVLHDVVTANPDPIVAQNAQLAAKQIQPFASVSKVPPPAGQTSTTSSSKTALGVMAAGAFVVAVLATVVVYRGKKGLGDYDIVVHRGKYQRRVSSSPKRSAAAAVAQSMAMRSYERVCVHDGDEVLDCFGLEGAR